MELILNLAWVALASLMFWLWLRSGARGNSSSRPMQMIALATVILILLPAISMTDDLQMARNPAETEQCQRRDSVCADAYGAVHAVIAFIPSFSSEPRFGPSHFMASVHPHIPAFRVPATDSIQNRPPPAA